MTEENLNDSLAELMNEFSALRSRYGELERKARILYYKADHAARIAPLRKRIAYRPLRSQAAKFYKSINRMMPKFAYAEMILRSACEIAETIQETHP